MKIYAQKNENFWLLAGLFDCSPCLYQGVKNDKKPGYDALEDACHPVGLLLNDSVKPPIYIL
ncbi:MAG: hypothetical protein P0Y53_01130 [Candidatus Pseudobacter hemicellulosilyticus]|uniref:Uncharacterized protein n=1 Tax=Candidatus Pseudobacter hemicellulosilyticus TaxID=3121375 RepID=A0AAJ5WXE6_9BACT|nr:MAG: hypothetical protein P0Y53_01130 [Pseudobacter sp.]